MKESVQIIRGEHRNLVALLSGLRGMLRDAEARRKMPDLQLLEAVLDYLENFLNAFHHPKETRYLFPALQRRHKASGKALAALEREHGEIAPRIADLRHLLSACRRKGLAGLGALREAVEDYAQFETQHMGREERDIIPAALAHLHDEDWQTIDGAFAGNKDPLFGPEPRQAYAKLFSQLAARTPAPHGFGEAL